MDEVQGWWEVPAIAHFCYAFRDAFNLLYFEIGELEAAILNMQDPEMSISLEHLIMRLLQGCFEENDVRSDNWEAKLHELFEENFDGENPVQGTSFHFLSPRLKVEVLHKLCEFRLDAEGALDVIKDIPAEDMKASCVGKDSQNNLYWYFCDERLYKEDPSKKPKKAAVPVKSANVKNSTIKNVKRATTRERKPVVTENNNSWSIVCHTMNDWETLIKGFSKSKNANEKELVNQVKTKYLPLLKDVVSEKDRLLRKRYVELAPKRASSRISKVQAQRKMEEQRVTEVAETKRIEQEEERAKREAEKKKNEKDERRKRAEEREKIIHGRSIRAKQREMMRGCSTDSESSSEETNSGESQPKRACRSRTRSSEQNTNQESDSEDEGEASLDEGEASSDEGEASSDEESSSDNDARYASESAHSSKNSSRRQSINNNSSDNDSDQESFRRNPFPSKTASHSVSRRQEEQRRVVRPSVVRNSYNSTCNKEVDTPKQKVSNITYNQFQVNKHLNPNEVNYNLKTNNSISTKDSNATYYRYLKTCTKVTSSPSIIRIDFIKPPAAPQS